MRRSRLVRRCGSRRRSTVWCCPRATIPEPPVSPPTTWGTAPCRTIVKPSRVRGHVQSPDRGHGTGRPRRRATAPSRGCARLPRCYRSPDSSPDSMKRSLHLASLLVALPAALIAQQGAERGRVVHHQGLSRLPRCERARRCGPHARGHAAFARRVRPPATAAAAADAPLSSGARERRRGRGDPGLFAERAGTAAPDHRRPASRLARPEQLRSRPCEARADHRAAVHGERDGTAGPAEPAGDLSDPPNHVRRLPWP